MSAAVERFFGEDSPLRRAADVGGQPYEPRPQQRSMAAAVAESLAAGTALVVEAPTGVGKTFAYLAPAIGHALARDMPVVVSTHTISLQEQVLGKDIPILQALLDTPFRSAVAKGRSNYVCMRRLQALGTMDASQVTERGLLAELGRIWQWVGSSPTGCLSDLGFEPSRSLWDLICCEQGNCLNHRCPHARQCFLMRARSRLSEAHIIVANHALFFSDLGMKQTSDDATGVLPDYAAVILDEAHTLEDCAAEHMGIHVSSFAVRRLLSRLYDRDRDRGLLAGGPWAEAREAALRAADATALFFRQLVEWLDVQNADPLRYLAPGHIPHYTGPHLQRVAEVLPEVIDGLRGDPDTEGKAQELAGIREQLQSLEQGLDLFLSMRQDGCVYWLEKQGREKREVLLNVVPVAIGPLLKQALFRPGLPVILTSATLAVRGRLDYFLHRIGADGAHCLVLDTPFDYGRQVTLYLPEHMPSPRDLEHFLPEAANRIRKYLSLSRGRAFVLFTSYSMMRALAAELQPFFAEQGIQLFLQGDGLPRSKMLQAFRKDVSSVIFGTSSFWTGVDVPGEALSNVIIVKLPFHVPDHPLVAAREEDIEGRGGRPFYDYSLPEAVLRFRQGFGRLIRSRNDTGMVVVLDSRILRSSYGRAFLDSIPRCNVVIE